MAGSFFDNLPIYGTRHRIQDDPKYVRTPELRQSRRERNVAGSYNHIVNSKGDLRSNESFVNMVENLGDAYETVEEMYGMIWWLANHAPGPSSPEDLVEKARQKYTVGLQLAKANKNKKDPHRKDEGDDR